MFRITRYLVTAALAVSLAALVVPNLSAQTSLNQSTLASAQALTDATVTVTSASGIAVGDVFFVDKEAEVVTAISGTRLTVTRGQLGTAAAPHLSGANFWDGTPNLFHQRDMLPGSCVASNQVATPFVNTTTGNVFDCQNGKVYKLLTAGSGGPYVAQTYIYTAAGAIAPIGGVHYINGTTLHMTLVAPTAAQEGQILVIRAYNGSAHVVTLGSGDFDGGSNHIATFGGAAADGLTIVAVNGSWRVIQSVNITFS